MVIVIQARPVKLDGVGHASKRIDGSAMEPDQGSGSGEGNGLWRDGWGQPSFRGRGFLDRSHGLSMAGPALRVRGMEQRIRAVFPLGQDRRMGESFQGVSGRSGLRIPDHRFNHRPGSSTRGRRKRGTRNQSIGRSRGGLTSKIHIAVDALGNPLRFILTPGQWHDITQAEDLVEGLQGEHLLADKAYDSDEFRDHIDEAGMEAVIPPNRSRSRAIPYDKEVYKERHLVECFINKIKHFRRIATRYEKTDTAYMAMLFLAGAVIWMR